MGEGNQGFLGFDSLFPLLDLLVSLLASRCLLPSFSSVFVSPSFLPVFPPNPKGSLEPQYLPAPLPLPALGVTCDPALLLVAGDVVVSAEVGLSCDMVARDQAKWVLSVAPSPSRCLPKVLPTSVDPLPTVAGGFEGTSERTASRVSSATNIWESCSNVESDVELSKPGILLSKAEKSPEVAGRCQGSQGPSGPYSGASNRLTFSSDPLMVSTDSSSSGEVLSRVSLGCPAPVAHEDPGGEEAAGASRDSCPPPSWDSTSLGTHEVRMDHYPCAQLGADKDLQDGAGPLGNSQVFDLSRGHDTATSSPQAKVPPGDSNGPSLLYIVPAVGIAVISAVAFLVYARLQK